MKVLRSMALIAMGAGAVLAYQKYSEPVMQKLEDLAEDTSSFKGFFKNRVTRILLVVICANVFSSIATIISGLDIVKTFLELF